MRAPAAGPGVLRHTHPAAHRRPARGASLWHVIDDKGTTIHTLQDDDPNVTAVRKLVALHSGAVDNRSPDTVSGSVEVEFSFYDKAFAARLESERYADKLVRLFTDNALTTRQTSVAWYQSTFHQDMRTAKVDMESTFEFTAASPEYLAANQFELNKPYTQRRTLSLHLDGDTWRIGTIEKSHLSKPNPKPGG
ncbi:hypothetical protein ACFQV2_20000 [Actinokineospora soli]|uniref:Mce-associated membrane protein n=1 Tax=Actinokineospora soli TaxID=1048753 RepID=A0ABW2TNT0_9PSEU